MANILKKSTNLTGLAVSKKPHYTLCILYGKIMRALEMLPKDAAYRKYTEKIIQERSEAVGKYADVESLEKAINCGQVEELIVQAEKELLLARKMLIWKPWEPLIQEAPAKQWDWPPAKITEPEC